jgi:hypothetical protein
MAGSPRRKKRLGSHISASSPPLGAAGEELQLEKNGDLDCHPRNLGRSRFGLHMGLVERHDRSMPEMLDRVYD